MDTAGNEKAILARLNEPESPLLQRVLRNNQILLHNYRAEVAKKCRCLLDGCARAFEITLIPNQVLYPKFCEDHRSEFRREFHLQQIAAAMATPVEDSVEFSAAS